MTKVPVQDELLPHLASLDRLIHNSYPPDKISAIHRELEQLPYNLQGAYVSLCQLEEARLKAISDLPEFIDIKKGTKYVLPKEHLDPISFALDSYLFFVRRACDSLVSYLGRCPKPQSLPSSMDELARKLKGNKFSLDSEVKSMIFDFWSDYGRALRNYRNQTTHKAIIVSNCVLFYSSNESFAIAAYLPDDPSQEKPSAISYNKEISLIKFVLKSYKELLKFINSIISRLIDLIAPNDPKARQLGIVSLTRGGAKVGNDISGDIVPLPFQIKDYVLNKVPDA